jgi:exopolysaccharide production protein ExoZ
LPIVLEFAMGMLIALAAREGCRLPPLVCTALVVIGAAGFVASYWHGNIDHLVIWGIPSALVVAGVTLAGPCIRPGPLFRGTSFMGDASYSLYLAHPIAITLPGRLFGAILNPAAAPVLYAMFLLVTALIVACAVHVGFERPLTRYLQEAIASLFSSKTLARA